MSVRGVDERVEHTSADTEPANRSTLTRQPLTYAACIAAMVGVTAFIALSYWPGRINSDTRHEIEQARSGSYTDQHAPILQAIWHLFFFHGLTTGAVLFGQIFTLVFGSFLILRLAFGPAVATLTACLIMLTPPVLGTVGLVGRDTWFTAATVLAFGLVAAAIRREGRARKVMLALSLVATWLALASRQNAAAATIVVTVLGIALLRYGGCDNTRPEPGAVRNAVATLALAVAITLVCMGSQWVLRKALSVQANHPEAQLQIYDLAALSRADHVNYFPASVLRDRTMRTLNQRANVDNMVPMIIPGGPIKYPFDAAEVAALNHAWKQRIEQEPVAYLRERTILMLRQLGITTPIQFASQNDITKNSWGYRTTFPSLNRFTTSYVQAFENKHGDGGVIYRVWVYLLAAIAIAVALIRRRSWSAALLAGLAIAPLTYEVGLFFGVMASGYRYQYPATTMIIIAVVGGVGLLIGDRRDVGRTRQHPAPKRMNLS